MILQSGDTARGRAMRRQQVEEYDDERVTAIMRRPPAHCIMLDRISRRFLQPARRCKAPGQLHGSKNKQHEVKTYYCHPTVRS